MGSDAAREYGKQTSADGGIIKYPGDIKALAAGGRHAVTFLPVFLLVLDEAPGETEDFPRSNINHNVLCMGSNCADEIKSWTADVTSNQGSYLANKLELQEGSSAEGSG